MDSVLDYKPKDEDDFYKILGCDELSTTDQINAEYRARVLACHPDKNPDDPEKEHQFHLLQRAKDVLTNEESRKVYDTWRRSGLAVPYDQWVHMRKNVHISMHWAMKKRKEPMLEHHPVETETTTHKEGSQGAASSSSQDVKRDCSTGVEKPPTNESVSRQPQLEHFSFKGSSASHIGTSQQWGWRDESWSTNPPSETLRKFRNYEI
ncbi:dnaJ homolog subfamily C member 12-like [Ptychodera flava]|uniref:dnaJ homolog subfamily C member 12-like n=1 Tax=Ptychodera flava TaxID=63121 RepID=UPI003969C642